MVTQAKAGIRLGGIATAFACALHLSGCALDGESIGKVDEALSHPGAWDIPDETVAIGNGQYVSYTGAGPWVGESGCGGGILPGAQVFREWLEEAYPQISSIGGYSCRPIVGNESQMSVHATGRALDVMIPTYEGEADNDLGDPIGNWLIEHSEEIGIQYIIWDRWQWNSSRDPGSKERSYGGTHPHHDHLHVELSVAAANMETAWFMGSMDLPESTACPVPAGGGEVDETADCFSAFGNGTYWRRVTDAGYGGSLVWTNAFENDRASNWARFHLDVAEAGNYEVQVYVDPTWGVYQATRYAVRHGGVEHEAVVDQSAADGWVTLGAYDFAAGGGQHVSVFDNSPTPVAPEQHIAVDAIRLVPTTLPPEEPPPTEEPPPPPPMMDGDPTIDDDPMPGDLVQPRLYGEVKCSATPGPSGSLTPLALLGCALALVASRRRRR
jgi:hypothetical protein